MPYRMSIQEDYNTLVERVRVPGVLGTISELLGWDQQVMMPKGAAELRAKQAGVLSSVKHRLFTDPQIGQIIERLENAELSDEQRAMVREIAWDYRRAVKVPNALVREIAEVTSEAEDVWENARKNNDFASFAPWLERIVGLLRTQAHHIDPGKDPYEVLFQDYESGLSVAEANLLLNEVKEAIIPIITQYKDVLVDTGFLKRAVPQEAQLALNKEIAAMLGYDFSKGRLDISTHPFTAGYGRITTRFEETWHMPILSTIHESGHGMYEHDLPMNHVGTPLGEARSFAVHESQSRLWENMVGKSPGFWKVLHPKLKENYGEALDGVNAEMLIKAVNRIEPGFIRVDADEVTYTLHILLRFQIEQEIIGGRLPVNDIPARWNDMSQELLGITPSTDSLGCLQDVHWAGGAFGYFPSYALGNLMAAQQYAAAKRANPLMEEEFGRGEFSYLRAWLHDSVQQHGRRYPTKELIERATGKPLSSVDYISYLQEKFRRIYD
jgi:carboxypeptidase Taq